MRLSLAVAILAAMPAFAAAQPAASPVAQGEAAAPAFSADTPIEKIAADPAGKAVLDKMMPTLLTHSMYESFKAMSLRQIQPHSGGAITEAKLAEVDAALKAIKPAH